MPLIWCQASSGLRVVAGFHAGGGMERAGLSSSGDSQPWWATKSSASGESVKWAMKFLLWSQFIVHCTIGIRQRLFDWIARKCGCVISHNCAKPLFSRRNAQIENGLIWPFKWQIAGFALHHALLPGLRTCPSSGNKPKKLGWTPGAACDDIGPCPPRNYRPVRSTPCAKRNSKSCICWRAGIRPNRLPAASGVLKLRSTNGCARRAARPE